MSGKVIGVYGICNTAGVAVYEIDDFQDRVLAGLNDDEPEWCEMTTEDDGDELRMGFMFHGFFVPFDEVMRV